MNCSAATRSAASPRSALPAGWASPFAWSGDRRASFAMSQVQRKLTTILAADADGYSRVMEVDEVGALGALRAARSVFSQFIERHHGRIANTAGDGLIAEFPS